MANYNTVISLPVSADLSTYSHVSVKLTSTGIALAGPGDRSIGTMIRGNQALGAGQASSAAVGQAAAVFLSQGNGLHFIQIGNNTAIVMGDELEAAANGQFNKRVTRTGTATASTDLVNITAHGFVANTPVTFSVLTGGTGLTNGVTYYVSATGLTANVFSVTAAPGSAVIDITGDYSAVSISTVAAGIAVGAAPATSAGGIIEAILYPTPFATGAGASVTSTGTGAQVLQTTPTLITPVLGVATGTSLALTGTLTSSGPTGGGIGYATGAGGAVTQATNRTTGVTLSTLTGTITTNNASLAVETSAEFTVTNTTVAIGDVIIVSIQSGTNGGDTEVIVSTVAAGSFKLKVCNNNAAGGTAETGAILINFAVFKAVSS